MEKNEMNIGSYLSLSRRLFEHPLWNEDRVYSRFEAWIDLMQSAERQDSKQFSGNRLIEIKRGQLAVSLRQLAVRWKWGKHKVDNFFDLLASDGMIKKGTASGTGQTLVIICDYENYNPVFENAGQTKGQTGDTSGTAWEQKSNHNVPLEGQVSLDIIKAEFERFRKLYPGTKMGLDTEFENFKKKNLDFSTVVFALYPALEALLEWRKRRKASGRFVPEMANLQTWINQKRWEVELENSEEQSPSRTMEEIQAESKQKILDRLNGNT